MVLVDPNTGLAPPLPIAELTHRCSSAVRSIIMGGRTIGSILRELETKLTYTVAVVCQPQAVVDWEERSRLVARALDGYVSLTVTELPPEAVGNKRFAWVFRRQV